MATSKFEDVTDAIISDTGLHIVNRTSAVKLETSDMCEQTRPVKDLDPCLADSILNLKEKVTCFDTGMISPNSIDVTDQLISAETVDAHHNKTTTVKTERGALNDATIRITYKKLCGPAEEKELGELSDEELDQTDGMIKREKEACFMETLSPKSMGVTDEIKSEKRDYSIDNMAARKYGRNIGETSVKAARYNKLSLSSPIRHKWGRRPLMKDKLWKLSTGSQIKITNMQRTHELQTEKRSAKVRDLLHKKVFDIFPYNSSGKRHHPPYQAYGNTYGKTNIQKNKRKKVDNNEFTNSQRKKETVTPYKGARYYRFGYER